MYPRIFNPPKNHSFFLFGPRGSGKSTLLRSHFTEENCLYINLLLAEFEDPLRLNPDRLVAMVKALRSEQKYVIIDEVQKIPKLLDIVHQLIESTDKLFVLTGSSARRLKSEGANLLAGRAFHFALHPLVSEELQDDFSLETALRWGTLPRVFSYTNEDDKNTFLRTYAQSYLREEVWGEQFIRKLDPFRKFLEVAAQASGTLINYTNMARDTGVDDKTIKSYFEILEDTLMGYYLTSYSPSVRKTVYKSPKFYFFDHGVMRALALHLDVLPREGTSYYGKLFEHFVINQIIRLASYRKPDFRFFYLRTKGDAEIDLIIERPGKKRAIIEIKSTDRIREDHVSGLEGFRDEFPDDDFYCFSKTMQQAQWGTVRAVHWLDGISEIMA